ncbi:hypothetical protein MMC08_008528 [Hypocenomyce scalaris]|nr:hypothetical protein [Hypocenomyce scalaris]
MAIEDGVVLAECLSSACPLDNVPGLLKIYETLRMDRVHIITECARETTHIWHLPNGPEQEARDANLQHVAETATPDGKPGIRVNPNSWSDPSFQPWLFGFDAVTDAKAQLEKEFSGKVQTKRGFR